MRRNGKKDTEGKKTMDDQEKRMEKEVIAISKELEEKSGMLTKNS